MGEEKQRITLRIALIADDESSAEYYYSRFLADNKDLILIPGRKKAIFKDGTIVEKIPIYDLYTSNNNYDQVLVCIEDTSSLVSEEIVLIMKALLMSQVPAGYQFLCYEE